MGSKSAYGKMETLGRGIEMNRSLGREKNPPNRVIIFLYAEELGVTSCVQCITCYLWMPMSFLGFWPFHLDLPVFVAGGCLGPSALVNTQSAALSLACHPYVQRHRHSHLVSRVAALCTSIPVVTFLMGAFGNWLTFHFRFKPCKNVTLCTR